MLVSIASEIRQACPALRLGLLQARVQIQASSPAFWQLAEPLLQRLAREAADQIRQQPVIAAARAAYKALGQDPSRYRLSAEALRRRLMKEQGLYRLCNLVDLINLLSLQTGYSIGGYDAGKIEGAVELRLGRSADIYQSIGRGQLNISYLPVLADQLGPFGNPTSDSARTSIQAQTTQIWLVFFDFASQPALEGALELASQWLQTYAEASEFKLQIQEPFEP